MTRKERFMMGKFDEKKEDFTRNLKRHELNKKHRL
jgi:hypothetical protein